MSETNKQQMITLTADQQAEMEKLVDSWVSKYALSTDPADRLMAEDGIYKSYEAAGYKPPSRGIIWTDSPLEGAILQSVLIAYGSEDTIMNDAQFEECKNLANIIRNEYLVNKDNVKNIIPKDKETLIRKALWEWTSRSIWGQYDAPWLAFYAYFLYNLKSDFCEPLRGQIMVSQAAGNWWPFDQVCIVSDRPTTLAVDERYRLHSLSGAALNYRDGFKVYAVHGIEVPSHIIEHPETITTKDIQTETNAEIRRILLEQYGFKKYVENSNAVKRDVDPKYGTLWAVDIPNDETIVMVEVDNSTPEPDGSVKKYMLQVPPEMNKVRDAIAWTFGIEQGTQYAPAKET